MNKTRISVAVLVATMLSGAALAHDVKPNDGAMRERGDRMDKMMDSFTGMNGVQRDEMRRNHMSMMQEQMTDMHGMMAGHGGMMPSRGAGANSETPHRLDGMQERMDLMQKIMEHMVQQQKMMMDNDKH